MKITTITVTYGGKLNLGNYQSANIEVSIGAEIEEHEDRDAVARLLFDEAKAMVQERARPLIQARDALIDGIFTALPASVRATIKED
jgi:hypothetical protein